MKDLEPIELQVSPDGFLNLVHKQNGGHLVDELNREIAKGVGAVMDHGGTSEVTLKLKFSAVQGVENGINITHDVLAKHPREKRPPKVMFVSTGNGLLDQPQKQETMDFAKSESSKTVSNISKL